MDIPLLTSGESRVYQALNKLGGSSIGDIIKISGVSHSKIYDILKRLSKKGLVSSTQRRGKQYFESSTPKRLSELINDKEKELLQQRSRMDLIIQQLEARKGVSQAGSVLGAYEGFKGMKTVLEGINDRLSSKDEVLILGSPKKIGTRAGGFLKEWQRKRIATGASCKLLVDCDSVSWDEKWWKKNKKEKKTVIRRSDSSSPAYLVITKNSVATIYFSEIILAFVVDHPEISSRYVDFFNILWKTAK